MVRLAFQFALLLAIVLFAWARGERPERIAAAAMLAQIVLDRLYHLVVTPFGHYLGIDWWHFSLDCALLGIFVALGLFSRRLWPVWLGGAQLLAVAGHLLRGLDPGMNPLVYAILERTPFWIAIVILALASLASHRRRKAGSTS